MKTMLFLLLLFLFPGSQDKVMICKSSGAYAYHNHRCLGLKKCTHAVEYMTVKEALALKRKPCGYCYDAITPSQSPPENTTQCAATTKKGSRCSRKATANGFCWQHG
jgi:hypothetical protein